MIAHTLPGGRYRTTTYPDTAIGDRIDVPRAKPGDKAARGAAVAPARIDDLLVVLAPNEPHREVTVRVQLLAQDAGVSRAVVLAADTPKWHRYVPSMPVLRSRLSALATLLSARVLRASFPREASRVEAWTRASDVIRRANGSDVIVVARRHSPWTLTPLARHARKLLRRTRKPLLLVGARPEGPYRNVVIAADLETNLDVALKWARHVAPNASFTFLHVATGRHERARPWAGARDDGMPKRRLTALRNAATRMAVSLARHRFVGRFVLVHGSPVHDVLRKARELDADLVVVVKNTRSWWADVLGASVSTGIAARADRDVLVVHGASGNRFGMPA